MSPLVDVLVVGGGPVGLAAAIEARLAGLDVVVLEARRGVIDKACGEGLMPGAVRALERLGVRPMGFPLAGIAYVSGARRAEHRFADGPGLGARRTQLHVALAVRAVQLGVIVRHERVTRIEQGPATVSAGGVDARWLLACDGLHSRVRQLVGLDDRAAADRAVRRFGLRRHYRRAPWSDVVEVHWSRSSEAYVTPVGPDLVGVALLGPPGTGYQESLAGLPDLAARLRDAVPVGTLRGAGPLRQVARRRTAGRVRLVGDAAGYVDALTGEGIRVGLAQARAAVATLDEGPDAYEAAWSEATHDYRVLTSGLLRAAHSPLRAGIVPAAVALPRVYGAVVERLAR
ncbi:NAD(P)/FAD-dependent oxidoreductase [Cellulomonas chengniuliangii]|uniref:FAD-dependent monooxygenase n=1 Tax=Cellulomonas chengniuliangii TaxID=2968084 RepID=A0ABY5L414_9CELL|nr:FAD-dependent monooxygenase [Cellulomonas chengniuliangii]MCC2308203.1 FAD-dependent monooxygenase [Cellulomonas chengniuliangii]MCC2317210.1 FAD-dependent monooxygenase [Cellulomonas chengniuliangii]UUI76593.1 FAD-dependent monooxygenase [Cellulomonas chengniuliangii]